MSGEVRLGLLPFMLDVLRKILNKRKQNCVLNSTIQHEAALIQAVQLGRSLFNGLCFAGIRDDTNQELVHRHVEKETACASTETVGMAFFPAARWAA